MADFKKALTRTLQFEGGFSQDKDDPGGMTYCGIARNKWPLWFGWAIIDALLAAGQKIEVLQELEASVEEFYREHFWKVLDMAPALDDEQAWYLFDTAVNCGTAFALKLRLFTLVEMRLARITRYSEIINKNIMQVKYIRGWLIRALARLE